MVFEFLTQNSRVLKITIFVVSLLMVTASAASALILPSNYSPVIVGLAPVALATLVISIRKPAWLVYATVIVVLLPSGFLPASIQSNLNRFLPMLALAAWSVHTLLSRRPITLTMTGSIMVVFLVWCLVTFFWADNLTMAKYVLGGYVLRFVLFLFLVSNVIKDKKSLEGFFVALAVAGWVFVTAGLFTLITRGYQAGTRFQIFEGNENTLGMLFPIALIGVIWPATQETKPHKNLWYFLSILFLLLTFFLIAISGSRGSLIAWVIIVIALFLSKQTRRWGKIGLVILLLAVMAAPFVLSTTIDRFSETSNSTTDSVLGGREALWKAAVMIIQDHPLTGVGIGNSRYAMMAYVRFFRSVPLVSNIAIHNPILTICVDTGLIGLVLYLGVLLSAITCFIRQFLSQAHIDSWMMPYYGLTFAAFCGYFSTWIKGGGVEVSYSYFLMLAILILPSHIQGNWSFEAKHTG